MHDLVHDLAVSILDDQILDHSKQGNVMGTNYQYALLSDRSTPQESLMTPPATLTALRFLDSNTTTVLDVSVFAPATSLRVLDLRVRATLNLPDSIGQLKQLRYLSAPDIIDKMVPECISEFSNLIYLRLWGSSIVELPNSIGELKSIMHLDLSYCSALNQLPESLWNLSALIYLKLRGCHIVALPESIGELKNLRHLDLSYCFKLQQLPASFSNLSALNYLNLSKSSIVALPESIGELKKLRHLDLSYCSSLPQLPASFRNIGKLEHLNLSCCYHISSLSELLWRLSGLEYLNLKHCLNIGDLIGQLGGLTKLQYLNLARDMYGYDDNLSGLPTFLVNLTKLRYLNLANCLDKDESLISLDSICELSNLEHLDLQGNRHLYMIPDAIRNLSKLHTLNLSGCSQLRRLPVSMSKINSLKFLRVSDCSCLDMSTLPQNRKELNMFPYFVVHASDGESTSNICGLEYEDGPFLKILMLENVKSAEEAQRIELGEKKMIKKLELAWTGGAKRFIDDERILEQLRPPATVENFVLQGYKSVSFPSWMMDDIATFLPRLKFITLQGLPSCDKLPPLGWLPNLIALYILEMDKIRKIDMDFYGGKTDAFPKLNLLKLQHMEHLEEWDTACMFPKLSVLDVKYCPMLRFRSGLPLSSCNTSNKLSIFGSDNVILSPLVDSGASSSTATYRLDVHCCEAPLDQWVLLHHLHCLEDLRIKNCSNLTCRSAEILQCLSSLKALSVKKFNSALELPEWLGDITSLKKLKVSKCEGIRTLPDSIQEVKCIEHLEVKKCPELIQWCKSKENEMKLAHIKAIILDGELFKFDWEPDTEEETNLMYLRVNASASSTNSLAAVESILAAPVRDYCSVFSSVNPIQGADLPLTALPEGVTACAVLARTVVEPVQEAAEIMENQGPITAAPRKRRASKLEEPERRETPRSKRLMKHPMA